MVRRLYIGFDLGTRAFDFRRRDIFNIDTWLPLCHANVNLQVTLHSRPGCNAEHERELHSVLLPDSWYPWT